MARHKTSFVEQEADLDISSMTDICFLLLIYFLVSTTIVPRERDLRMALPVPGVTENISAIEPMFIRVDAEGVIFSGTGAGERMLDTDEKSGELPVLSSQLQLYAAAARSAGTRPLIQVLVDSVVKQQRVVDVLNAIASAEIEAVTFTDLVDAL